MLLLTSLRLLSRLSKDNDRYKDLITLKKSEYYDKLDLLAYNVNIEFF